MKFIFSFCRAALGSLFGVAFYVCLLSSLVLSVNVFAHPLADEWTLKVWPKSSLSDVNKKTLDEEVVRKLRWASEPVGTSSNLLKKLGADTWPVQLESDAKPGEPSGLEVGLKWADELAQKSHRTDTKAPGEVATALEGLQQEILGGRGLSWDEIFWTAWDYRQPFITVHLPKPKLNMGGALARFENLWNLSLGAKAQKQAWVAEVFLGMALHSLADLSHPFHCSQFGSTVLMPWMSYLRSEKVFHKKAARLHYAMRKVFNDNLHDILTRGASSPSGILLHGAFQAPKPTPLLANALKRTDTTPALMAYVLARASAQLAPQSLAPLWSLWGERIESLDQDFPEVLVTQADFDELNSSIVKTKLRNKELINDAYAEHISNFVAALTWLNQQWQNAP